MRNGLFIVGTDTEVGKTHIACGVLRSLRQRGLRPAVYKPVASGGQIGDPASDPSLLAEAAGLPLDEESLRLVCPQYFRACVAPPAAAELEGKRVDDQLLTVGLDAWADFQYTWDAMIVEGAGGLLSPVSNSTTVLDLAVAMRYPVAVVAANRLGVVNHTLLTLAQLAQTSLEVVAVVLNTQAAASTGEDPDASTRSNRQLLQQFTDTPIVESAEELCAIAFP